jgi:hypothetical protein
LAHSKNALRLAAQILKIKKMKKSVITKTESLPLGGKHITNLEIDKAIARYKIMVDNAPSEHSKEFYQGLIDDLLFEKEYTIKATNSIIKAAIKGTMKWIRLCYPSLLKWNEKDRYSQLRTKRRPFSENMINEFGKTVHSISVTCEDGMVRIFDIKIEAFWGYRRQSNSRPKACVNLYFSLREPSQKKNQIPVEFGAN